MVKFSDKGKGYRGDPQGHSENARGIRHKKTQIRRLLEGEIPDKMREREYIQSKYHQGLPRMSKRELRALRKRRIAYARKYNEDAITGIPYKM